MYTDVLVATWVWRRNPDLEEIPFTCEIRGYDQLFVNVPEYSDLFRIKNYPKKIITNRKNLRRWMGKRYFTLTNEQLKKVSQFLENIQEV